MIKNEIGDVAIDSQLASSAQMAATQELLGDCICCVNIGQLGDALADLDQRVKPDRIVIETSGSAEPLKLVLEIKRLSESTGRYELDGIVSVLDAENWGGYASTSFTAKLQAKQTDLIVINKWESLSERSYEDFLDKLGDLDVDTPQVKSDKGWVSPDVLLGFDAKLARPWLDHSHDHEHGHDHSHEEGEKHTSEVECLSVQLPAPLDEPAYVDLNLLQKLLSSAPKDEVYRIKALCRLSASPKDNIDAESSDSTSLYILNWSFGRWRWTRIVEADSKTPAEVLRMSIFTAPYESNKWSKKVKDFVRLEGGEEGNIEVKRVQ